MGTGDIQGEPKDDIFIKRHGIERYQESSYLKVFQEKVDVRDNLPDFFWSSSEKKKGKITVNFNRKKYK